MNPAITAADLRNAALVMDHLGKTEEQYVDGATGGVCMEGAIALATDEKLMRIETADGRSWLVGHPIGKSDLTDRRDDAMIALMPLMPTVCTVPQHELDDVHLVGKDLIYHYSDYVCDGAEQAISALIEAAEKLEAEL